MSIVVSVEDDDWGSIGMLKVRETDGKAVRPDRSASRLLAASHTASFSESDLIQAKGLDIMRVR